MNGERWPESAQGLAYRVAKLEEELREHHLRVEELDMRYVMRQDVRHAHVERREWVVTVAVVCGSLGAVAGVIDVVLAVFR